MRDIKLSGREAAVVRAIGFVESMLGAEILDSTRMELEDVGDTLNGLIAAGFVETIPYAEQVDLAEMPSTAFEVNPAYVRIAERDCPALTHIFSRPAKNATEGQLFRRSSPPPRALQPM